MTIKSLANDARLVVFALLAGAIIAVENFVERLRDRLNGDVASVLDGFDGKIERARMAAVRKANTIDRTIQSLEAALLTLDDDYDAQIAAAERAARVQGRIAKLLD